MTWQARTAVSVVLGSLVLLPVAWVLFEGTSWGTWASLSDAMRGVDVAGELATSLFLALLTTFLAVLLGLPLAFHLALRTFPGRRGFRALVWLPLLIPAHIHNIAWTRIIGDRGWLTGWLKSEWGFELTLRSALGNPATDPVLGHLYLGPAWIMACAYFPLVTLVVMAGLRSLDGSGLDAARLAGGRRAILRVALPQVAPRILAGALFVFILSLTTYPVVSLLDTPTLVHRVFGVLAQGDRGFAAAAWIGTPLVVVAMMAIFLFARVGAVGGTSGLRRPDPLPGGVVSWSVVVGILLIASALPLGSLIKVAGPLNLSGSGPPDSYQLVFPRVRDAFAQSLFMTGLSVAALLTISWPLGRILSRSKGNAVEVLTLGALALLPEILGVSLLAFWSALAGRAVPVGFLLGAFGVLALPVVMGSPGRRPGQWIAYGALVLALTASVLFVVESGVAGSIQKEGVTLVVLACVVRFMPFVLRIFRAGFAELDREEEDAAHLAGHGPLRRQWSVVRPRMMPVVGSAAVLAYVLCFTELPSTLQTLRPGWQSIQIRIFNMVHFQQIEEVCALCVMVVGLAALPVFLLLLLLDRQGEVS